MANDFTLKNTQIFGRGTRSVFIPVEATTVATTKTFGSAVVPVKSRVVGARYLGGQAAGTFAGTLSAVSLMNGATVVATVVLVAGDIAALSNCALTLSSTAANLLVAAGDKLTVVVLADTGATVGIGQVQVDMVPQDVE